MHSLPRPLLILLLVLLAGCASLGRNADIGLADAQPPIAAPSARPAADGIPSTEPPLAVALITAYGLHADAEGTFWVAVNASVWLDGGLSHGQSLTYRWDLGDGAVEIGVYAGHVFQNIGNFTGRLTVQDPQDRSNWVDIRFAVTRLPWGAPPPMEVSGRILAGNPLAATVGGVTEIDCGRTPQLEGVDGSVFAINETYWQGQYELRRSSGLTGSEVLSVWFYDEECRYLTQTGARAGTVPRESAYVVVDLEMGAQASFLFTAMPGGY